MITFNEIPDAYRIPGIFVEFDPSRANTGQILQKLVVLGQRLSTGTVAEGTPMSITTKAQAKSYFGRGSMLAHMLEAILATRPSVSLWAIALDDLLAGQAATGSITFTGAASTTITYVVTVAGRSVAVQVAQDDAQNDIAAAIAAGINADLDFPVTASVATNVVTLTARHKGEYGNDLLVTITAGAKVLPTSPAMVIAQPSGGVGNPDVTNAIAAMGDTWYHWIVNPWTDDTNMDTLETELDSRFSPLRQVGCRAFAAVRGTYGQMQAYGDSRNPKHVTCMGTGIVPKPPHIWAAVNAAIATKSLANDPSQQLQGLELIGLEGPAPEMELSNTERNNLLFDGISTYTVDAAGRVYIEAQITMYQENPQGAADDSMLYLNIPETFERYRLEVINLFQPYRRAKLMEDGSKLPAGQRIMTPKQGKGMMQRNYTRMVEEKAWCEDIDSYNASLIVEKQTNRLAIVDQPNFVDNFRQLYMRSEQVA